MVSLRMLERESFTTVANRLVISLIVVFFLDRAAMVTTTI